MNWELVEDPDDQAVRDYVGLRDPAHRRRVEAETGVFVAEGVTVVERLASSGWPVRSVLVASERLDTVGPRLAYAFASVRPEPRFLAAGRSVIDRVAGFAVHRGVLAIGERPEPTPWRNLVGAAPGPHGRVPSRIVLAEGLTDQANLGSLFRSAAALGADAVLGAPGMCDPLYRQSVRVSMGTVFRLPFATLTPWPAALDELASAGWHTVALTPAGDTTIEALAASLDPAARVALLVGAEGDGLSEAALTAARHRVVIPMESGVDSLNVAVAAAVGLALLRPPLSPLPRRAPPAARSGAAGGTAGPS
ncbi:MAG: RNA methyltransferase [Acidimicrobiia bacterium]|nr:RNA methyltransferase [Acidimicrobiia bacterium]